MQHLYVAFLMLMWPILPFPRTGITPTCIASTTVLWPCLLSSSSPKWTRKRAMGDPLQNWIAQLSAAVYEDAALGVKVQGTLSMHEMQLKAAPWALFGRSEFWSLSNSGSLLGLTQILCRSALLLNDSNDTASGWLLKYQLHIILLKEKSPTLQYFSFTLQAKVKHSGRKIAERKPWLSSEDWPQQSSYRNQLKP